MVQFFFFFFSPLADHMACRTLVACAETLSCVWLCNPMNCSPQRLLCLGFSRQEYWSGWPFFSSVDLPDPGIETRFPALQADSLPSEPPGRPLRRCRWKQWRPDSQGKKIMTNDRSILKQHTCQRWKKERKEVPLLNTSHLMLAK